MKKFMLFVVFMAVFALSLSACDEKKKQQEGTDGSVTSETVNDENAGDNTSENESGTH
ncbi:MAG: hypothetical protein LBR09_02130 [Endomicrobium sp.]|jgi:uncharacterized lipoprotein YehR (DUF1307 family)|nr:hypothetical protein [Endomicrobium sp.]